MRSSPDRTRFVSTVSRVVAVTLVLQLVVLAIAGLGPLLSAPVSSNVDFVYHIGGDCFNVAVQGHYVYTHLERQLVVVDVSDPTKPAIVGRSAVLPQDVGDIAVEGDYAYVANGRGGLRIFDVSDPTAPTEVAAVRRSASALAVAVSAHRAYVSVDGGWYIFDVSEPTRPRQLSFSNRPAKAFGITLVGRLAYFAAWDDGLYIVNVSDPAQPAVAGHHDTPGQAHQVAVYGDYAYVADDYDGLRIYNVSDPSAPVPAGSFSTAGNTRGIALVGDHAYLADGVTGLRVVDVSNAALPVEVGWYDTPNIASAVAEMGRYAFVADAYGGLQVLHYTGPLAPNRPPSNGTITPSSGAAPAGRVVHFVSTYFDPNGHGDFKACRLHIGRVDAPKSLAGNAVLLYQARTNKLLIRNDRGTRWWGGKPVGSDNVIQNSQIKVYCKRTAVTRAGDRIDIRWAVEFKPAFQGRNKTYLRARDLGGLTSPLEQKGTWTVE